ncbi:MAG: hypothetical protein CSA81_05135 [Acidobacteria bacterium]|nr:MAG: hypothetical protein CSA81_05135 [Acidobacteriota bacterium]PIE91027.1 MAG: hypothetical protein CR997_02600 [Acidobacteriota bacterium]
MKKILITMLISLGAVALMAGDFSEAMKSGKVGFDLRYRFETVDQNGYENQAEAHTLRLRLGYTTAAYKGFQFHVDLETIQSPFNEVFDTNYNSTNNGKADYPVIADPKGTELNQAYFTYTGFNNSIFKVGRQRIIIDNARFIGNVGWRQNEQTFDAYTYVFTGIENGTLIVSNVQRVNRIFGEYNDNPLKANLDSNADVIHYNHKFAAASVSVYGHFIELQDEALVGASHKNLGFRITGSTEKLIYALEFANQSDYKDGSNHIDADYMLAELGAKVGKWTLKGGYEVLGGDGTYAFSTPLATLHAFNGWADKFLGTPVNGLVDLYFMMSTKVTAGTYPLVFKAFYHNFQSDNASIDYGTEFDAIFKLVLSKKACLVFRFADYNADDFATDTTKIWLMGGYKF